MAKPVHSAAYLLALVLAATGTHATVITVTPGMSLQDAIDAAAPGDTLLVEAGTYAGAVVVDKRLRIIGRGVPGLDALGGPVALEVAADGVTLKDILFVGTCATDAHVRAVGRRYLTLLDVYSNCDTPPTAGLELENVTLVRIAALSLGSIHIRQLAPLASVKLRHAVAQPLVLEDIGAGADKGQGGLRLRRCGIYGDVTLTNVDGIVMASSFFNTLTLDATSDNNTVRNCSGAIVDNGMGNCLVNNSPGPNGCP